MDKRPTKQEDEVLEAELKAKMGRRIATLEAQGDYRLLSQFDVEQAIAKAWKRILKLYGFSARGDAPEIDWVAIFSQEFKEALARELVHPIICDLLVEARQPDPREGAREAAGKIMKEIAEEKVTKKKKKASAT